MFSCAHSSDLRRERRWHLAIPACIGALGLILSVILGEERALTFGALILATMGIVTALPLFWSLPTAFLTAGSAAAGIALINALANLCGFVGPSLVEWLNETTGSRSTGMYFLAASLILAAILTLLIPPRFVNK